jgi:hypothetical protein
MTGLAAAGITASAQTVTFELQTKKAKTTANLQVVDRVIETIKP